MSMFNYALTFDTRVVNYPVPEGKTGQQMVDVLHKRVEQLGATKTGNFSVDCEMYQGKHSKLFE